MLLEIFRFQCYGQPLHTAQPHQSVMSLDHLFVDLLLGRSSSNITLCPRGHSYALPIRPSYLYKRSFILRCLFCFLLSPNSVSCYSFCYCTTLNICVCHLFVLTMKYRYIIPRINVSQQSQPHIYSRCRTSCSRRVESCGR